MAMFLSPITNDDPPSRKTWDNCTIHDGEDFIAFFNTTDTDVEPRSYGLDVARSADGVHWEFIARDLIPVRGAHAGYGILHLDDRTYYYPTVTDEHGRIHFKIFASEDYVHWEHLGDDRDVVPNPTWYAARWEETCILREDEAGAQVFYGYISAEVREEVSEPSLGMLKSYDGVNWEVLPPPVVDWQGLPPQHTEVNFCQKIDGRYYLSLNCRLHFDSYGYSSYTFIGDSPTGPFVADLPAFRLTGTTSRDVTWLAHPLDTPDGLLIALWLSARQELEIPSHGMGIGPLKRLVTDNGHLRVAWWEGNERAKGPKIEVPIARSAWVHPLPQTRGEHDSCDASDAQLEITAARDGAIALLEPGFDAGSGFLMEGALRATARAGRPVTHQKGPTAGFFFEDGEGSGYAILADALGRTRGGTVRFARDRITTVDEHADAGSWLMHTCEGPFRGLVTYQTDDTVGPFGNAPPSGIRQGRRHEFRLVGRGDFVEFYLDDWYVQTYLVPTGFTGRIGLLAFEGAAVFSDLRAWQLNL